MKNCIYKFLNKENEIIYIGKAKNLKNRLRNHNHLPKACYDEVVKKEFCILDTEDDMDFAERYYISKYKPKYNSIMIGKEITIDIPNLNNMCWLEYGSSKQMQKQLLTKVEETKRVVRCQYDILHKIEELKKMSIQYKYAISDIKIKIDNAESVYSKTDEYQELMNKGYSYYFGVGWKDYKGTTLLIPISQERMKYEELLSKSKELKKTYDEILSTIKTISKEYIAV